MTMLRTLFLSIHVAGGGVGLLLGAFALRRRTRPSAGFRSAWLTPLPW